jgi:hypothetical protein
MPPGEQDASALGAALLVGEPCRWLPASVAGGCVAGVADARLVPQDASGLGTALLLRESRRWLPPDGGAIWLLEAAAPLLPGLLPSSATACSACCCCRVAARVARPPAAAAHACAALGCCTASD